MERELQLGVPQPSFQRHVLLHTRPKRSRSRTVSSTINALSIGVRSRFLVAMEIDFVTDLKDQWREARFSAEFYYGCHRL